MFLLVAHRLNTRAGLLALILGASVTAGEAITFERDVRPLVETYCFPCHGPEKQKGDLNLSTFTTRDQALKASKIWRTARHQLISNEMPPAKSKQPTDAERQLVVDWIAGLRYAGARDPGRVTVRRLNRVEYTNTIRDLLAMPDAKPAEDFPSDDVGDGFDNIAEVLSLPPLLFEKYLDAASDLLDLAIVSEQFSLKVEAESIAGAAAGTVQGKERVLTAVGDVGIAFTAAVDGSHTVRVRAAADQAGNEPVKLTLKIDGVPVKELPVMAGRSAPATYTASLMLKKGPRQLAVSFLNPFTEPARPAAGGSPKRPGAPAAAPAGKTRALVIDWIEVQGPPGPPPPESHRRIMIAKPDATLDKRAAAKQVIAAFATRAFRKPVSEEQVERLAKVFDAADAKGQPYEEGVKLALQAVLISPRFLFRIEDDRPAESNGAHRLSDFDLAARLSYFLWSSMPDEPLAALARAGKLSDPAVVDAQVARMLRSPKARALTDNFAEQWLTLRNLDTIEKDKVLFPDFDPALRKAMGDEAALFFEMLLREDRSVLELIDADYTYVNARLAKHYGIEGITGTQMKKVQLPDHNRGGVLGMAGILAIAANPGRSNVPKRGKWVLEQLLGESPPPPPPNVAELPRDKTAGTLRERLEKHRADPGCASCHKQMDPIGFGLENFDALGRWRTSEDGRAIDASGVLPGGARFSGPAELKKVLLATRQDAFVRNLAERLLTYALGRGLEPYDEPAVDGITRALAANGYRASVLIGEVVRSYPFQHRRARSGAGANP